MLCDSVHVCSYGRDQTCAMLLAFLSGSSAVFGGNQAGTSSLTTEAINTARRALTELGGRPVVIQRGVQGIAWNTYRCASTMTDARLR